MPLTRTREEREARLHEGRLHAFELRQMASSLRAEQSYLENGRNGIGLVKTPELRVVLEVLQRGARIGEHEAPGPATVQVLEGEIRYEAGDEVHCLKVGELLAVPPHVRHTVEAVEDSAFLLTISPERDR